MKGRIVVFGLIVIGGGLYFSGLWENYAPIGKQMVRSLLGPEKMSELNQFVENNFPKVFSDTSSQDSNDQALVRLARYEAQLLTGDRDLAADVDLLGPQAESYGTAARARLTRNYSKGATTGSEYTKGQPVSLELEQLKNQVKTLEGQQEKLISELVRYRRKAKKFDSLPLERSDRVGKKDVNRNSNQQQIVDEFRARNKALKRDMGQLEVQLEAKNTEVSQLEAQLEQMKMKVTKRKGLEGEFLELQGKFSGLEQELVRVQNQLLVKQTEVEQLEKSDQREEKQPAPVSRRSKARVHKALSAPSKAREEVLVVTVNVPKANLRSGAGLEHSPIMQVKKGTRLMVEAKDGEWYRVLTPTGSRAYVKDDVVTRGTRSARAPKKPASRVVKGPELFSAPEKGAERIDEELEAFETLKRLLNDTTADVP